MTTDSPIELATIISTLQPIAEGNWRVQKAITMLQGMGEPLRHPEGKCNGLTSPANDELIAKLEAEMPKDYECGSKEQFYGFGLLKAVHVIRAHKPAPVSGGHIIISKQEALAIMRKLGFLVRDFPDDKESKKLGAELKSRLEAL